MVTSDELSTRAPSAEDDPSCPLTGIKVVDLSRLVSGNMLTHVLADLGATVIKVEPPRKGDELRAWQREGVSTYWLAYSRNKDSVAGLAQARGYGRTAPIDRAGRHPGRELSPGTLERMGLGHDALRSLKPDLVVVRISGWGQTGLFSDKGGFGSLIEAMSGFAAMNGFADRPPGAAALRDGRLGRRDLRRGLGPGGDPPPWIQVRHRLAGDRSVAVRAVVLDPRAAGRRIPVDATADAAFR